MSVPRPLLLLPLALLTACSALRTPYTAAPAELPAHWSAPAAAAAAVTPAANWWQALQDPALDRVVALALERNADLALAAITLRQARLQAGLADSDRRPSLSASVSGQTQRSLESPRTTTHSYDASLGVSWDADLWQRLGALADAAGLEAQASEEDRQAAALSLSGTAATLYWQLGYLNERVASAEASLDYVRRTRELVQAQYAAGAVGALERQEAEQSVASQQATLEDLLQQRTEARHALALLLDHAPGGEALAALGPEPAALPATPLPELRAGLPAELLGRRPDLRAAELRLRKSLAQGDASRASYYPSLSLTGSLGSSSAALGHLLANPVAVLGSGLTLPFLNQREMQLNDALQQANYEAAVVGFRQTLYSAFGEVENALSARRTLARQGEWLQRSLDAARRVESLYEQRYRAGAGTLKNWLDAQESRRSAELALAENRFARLKNQATLVQALGGAA
ncbi:RND transporter [Rubrivivax gelatinosus]|uniref:efflux transporter outer membrane subunit n=1 Tax=Rubrivivax gelatinosus TaxID=28068 RepID=UPI0019054302|nr:efflux transporter outer membrane subunit [Rubrivivax gelatinosus]MBK1614794.1 RND transporter [Rubrivivax gelatinosus]